MVFKGGLIYCYCSLIFRNRILLTTGNCRNSVYFLEVLCEMYSFKNA